MIGYIRLYFIYKKKIKNLYFFDVFFVKII